jgi:2-keto-3-deoxy-6-phosphogluconate aldolase
MGQQTTINEFSNNSIVITLDVWEVATATKAIRSCHAAGARIFEFADKEPDALELVLRS